MRKWLTVSLLLGGLVSIAQLPEIYTTSVYEEVKHPYPLFDDLGVISKKSYIYRSGEQQYYSYRLFEDNNEDSILIFQYEYDTTTNIITTVSVDEYDGERIVTKYYLKDKSVCLIEYPSTFREKRFLRKDIKTQSLTKTTYEYADSIITRSMTKEYSNFQKIGKYRSTILSSDSITRKTIVFNKSGFPSSIYCLNCRGSRIIGDSVLSRTSIIYNQKNTIDSILIDRRIVRMPWKKRYRRFSKFRSSYFISEKTIINAKNKTSFSYNEKNYLVDITEYIDSIKSYSTQFEYNDNGLLKRVITKDGFDVLYKKEELEYDSLNRITKKYNSFGTGGYYDRYSQNVCRKFITQQDYVTIYQQGKINGAGIIEPDTGIIGNFSSGLPPFSRIEICLNSIPVSELYQYEEMELLDFTRFSKDWKVIGLDINLLKTKFDCQEYTKGFVINHISDSDYEEDGPNIWKSFYTFKN